MDAFWKTGYSGTSLDEIAMATGMNRPSLRAAFGDKRDLYLRALRAYWALKFATLERTLAGETLKEALLRTYEAALSVYFSGEDGARGCFVVGTAITETVDDPEIRDIVAEGFQTLDDNFVARIRLARDAGELAKGVDVEALAILACGTMQTIALRARAGVPRETLWRLAQKAVAVICG
jgi:AcrR family transcriptional regulator